MIDDPLQVRDGPVPRRVTGVAAVDLDLDRGLVEPGPRGGDPLLDELFRAEAGGGASLNGRPLRVSAETDIGNFTYRSSIVTLDYADHHPQLFAGVNQFRRGDANNQGLGSGSPVDISDPIFMLSYLTGQGPFPPCLDAGDANNDGRLDFADPIYMLSYLVGQLPPFPAPFDCGYESDIDELDCQISQCP